MRNFTTNDAFTLVEPGTTVSLSNGNFGGPAYWGSGTNTLLQLAPKNNGVSVTGTGLDEVTAVTVQWHEQGSVEGILDMVNDQIAALPTNAGTRDATTLNPIWVNRKKFVVPNGAAQNGYNIGTFGTVGGQQRVQMAISDVNAAQGFSVGNAANAAWNKTVGQDGYGKGNQMLTAPTGTNLSQFGVAGGQVQFVDSAALNIPVGTLANGTTSGAGVWNTAGTGNLENAKVAATATLFVANAGTGLDKLNRTDAQWLQTSGRFSNGASFNVTTRDVNSGTRNVAASNTGVDPSFAVGVNDGALGISTSENLIGAGIKFSNKTAGGNLRTTVQNNRFSVGTLGLSDALSSTQGGSTPVRGLDYSDSLDGSSAYVRASAQTITDGTYAIWQNETYVTVKAPDAQYGSTNGANILGDPNGDVKAIRNNILLSSKRFNPTNTANVFGPSDGLIANSFIPTQLLQLTKSVDGLGTTSANPNYSASNTASFLGDSFATNKFLVGGGNSPNNVTAGSGSIYASNLASGTNAIAITDNGGGTGNYLLGNFNQTGTRDLASLKTALVASTALEAAAGGGLGTNATSAGGSLINSTVINYGLFTAKKGDLIVMGDIAGSGSFDGKSLYLLAKNATLSDSTSTDNLTFNGANTNVATLGDAIRSGVSRKNDALDYLNANATLQQKTEAAVNPADPVSVANAFNKFDINRDGRVSRNDAAIVDKFIGADKTDLNTQVNATIAADGSVNAAITQKSVNLFDVGLIDGQNSISRSDFALVRTALGTHLQAGDTKFRGSVDNTDIRQIIQRGFYNDGLTTHKWSDGDFTGDGAVNNADIRAIIQAGTYNAGNYDGGSPSVATPSLSGRGVTSAVTTIGTLGNGKKLHYVYNPATGDVTVKFDGVTGNVQEFDLVSSGNLLISANANAIFASGFSTKSTNELDALINSGSYVDGTDLGIILPIGLTNSQLTSDLTLSFSVQGVSSPQGNADLLIVATPEPTTLSLLGLGAMGLLARRRRNVTN